MAEQQKNEVARLPVALGAPVGDLDQAYRMSQALAMASVMPDTLRGKPSDVLALMLYGQDLGMSPMQSIQGIYVVKGKPQLSSTTWIALARRQGHKVRMIEADDTKCTVEITRKDDPEHPHRQTYTVNDAVHAGLCALKDGKPYARGKHGDKLPWEAHTATMLRNRAISNAAKFACPEVALGFGIEGDYDYVQDDAPDVTAPEHHGEVVDGEVVPEKVADEINGLADQFDFSGAPADAERIQDAEVVKDDDGEATQEPFPEYECTTCGKTGEHFEDECLESAAGPR